MNVRLRLVSLPALVLLLLQVSDRHGLAASARATGHRAPAARAAAPDGAARRAGADAGWLQKAAAQIARAEYRASRTQRGLQAPNRAQNLRTYFRSGGIEVVPRKDDRGAAWRFTWRTTRWGRTGALSAVPAAEPRVISEARVAYERPGVTEWYDNAASGLEQSFQLAARPAGSGPACLVGAVGAGLRAERKDGGLELVDPRGVHVLRYGALHVRDARGENVVARLSLLGRDEVAILIDDACATYPLSVDPLMTSPAWTAESNQAFAFFGISVSGAGDVNGDGYSDVIVGARGYDGGAVDEGAAFVYYGSASGLPLSPSWTAGSGQAGGSAGWSVASAGDVNGDGYSDVIVGAPLYSNGETNEGRAFVYLGSAGGLAASPAWTAESNQASADFGISVAGAGDVNGDGYADVIVGADHYSNGQAQEGKAFVYLGSATGPALAPAWGFESDQASALLGSSVASAGDVNSDGYADVIVGVPQYSNGQSSEGRAYVFYGSPAGLPVMPSWTFESNQSGALLGSSVAGAGDVNGDGYADVIVGAKAYDNGLNTDEGRAFVFHGGAAGLSLTANWTADSNQPSATFGVSVAGAGDVNGDGYADVIIGANLYDNGQSDEGRAFLYRGSATGLETSPAWTAESDQASANFGISVACAGDVNADGYSDVIVGASLYDDPETNEGRAYLYLGGSSGPATSAAWSTEGNQGNASYGFSVASAGDVNGDGYSDVIVGARFFDNGQADEGRAFVYHGSAAGLSTTPAWTAESNQASAFFGWSVASAGDVNGDGYSDVIVGAHAYDDPETNEGAAWVYLGSPTGLSTTASWMKESDQFGGGFGFSVASAGDVNGDGYSDVIIGAHVYDHFFTNEGRVFVYYGSPTGLSQNVNWLADGGQTGALFGWSVASAGDVNGDGYSDVIIGAPSYDNGETDEGRAYVYLGSASGLALTPAWTTESNQVGANYGVSVASAGDVDGDGYSDVIVGANLYDDTVTDQGRAFVYRGSASGLSLTPAWTAEADLASAYFGISVASAGDVNGDGYSDVVVGASQYGSAIPFEGRVFLYLGSPTGPSLAPDWTVSSSQQAALFGTSVTSAGDVNGDGYADVIVGAPMYDDPDTDEGAAFLYYGNGGLGGYPRLPRQTRLDDSAPISLLGLSANGAAHLEAVGHTTAGRGQVRLLYEIRPLGQPLNGANVVTGPFTDTGPPSGGASKVDLSALVSGLNPNTSYHWRARLQRNDPRAPWSPWFWLTGNAVTETDLRTGTLVGVAPISIAGPRLRLEARPNPFHARAEARYVLPARGRVHLEIYDLAGRQVARLVDRTEDAGPHVVWWRPSGASGLFYARLEFAGRVEQIKLVQTR